MKHGIIIAAALTVAGSSALADPTPVGTLKVFDSYGATGGGEFLVTSGGFIPGFTPGSLGENEGKFESFCLERFEDIVFNFDFLADSNDRTVADAGNIFYNGTMSNTHGGVQDVLDDRTAYLYEKFITHSLSDYHYASAGDRESDATALQIAFWVIEQELEGTNNTRANAWLAEAADAVKNGYKNLGQVRALNLYTLSTRGEFQDILVYVPLPPAVWAGLGTLGLVGVGQVIRRRRQAV